MPCDDTSHEHIWPTSGLLQIERCERYCAYCRDPKRSKTGKEWESARQLRKHVEVHTKPGAEFEDTIILKGKKGRPPRENTTSYRVSSASRQYEEFVDEDDDELLGNNSYRDPGLESSASRPAASLGRDRGAKRRAQEQIKISAALPLIYEPDLESSAELDYAPNPSPSPEPNDHLGDAEDDSIIFSEEESSVSEPRASAPKGKEPSRYGSRQEWAGVRPRINGRFPRVDELAAREPQHQRANYQPGPSRAQSQISSVNDAGARVFTSQRSNARPQVATAAAERPHRPTTTPSPSSILARRPEVPEISRLSGRGRGGRHPRSGIPRSRTPNDELEDQEPQSPPLPSAEALNRIQQHKERQGREMREPRHPNAGKRRVPPAKDYSQLWLKEFEPGG